jgi:hypothetical protein
MPSLHLRKPSEAPAPRKISRAMHEQQLIFERFIRDVDGDNVGELQLEPDEAVRSTKVRLRRAATRVGVEIEVWDVDGKVYFRTVEAMKGRRRSRKTA